MADVITLSFISLKESLCEHLDSSGWRGKYNSYLITDKNLENKQPGIRVTDSNKQFSLPVIIIGFSDMRERSIEVGSKYGSDVVFLDIQVSANDISELISFGNLIRRFVTNLGFNIYTNILPKTVVAYGNIQNVVSDNVSDVTSDNPIDKYKLVISGDLEIS